MARTNGRSETEPMDVEHELPASEDAAGDPKAQPSAIDAAGKLRLSLKGFEGKALRIKRPATHESQ